MVLSFWPWCTVLLAQAYTSVSLCTITVYPDLPRKEATPSWRGMPLMLPMPARPLLMRPLPSLWFSLMAHIRDNHSHLHQLLWPELRELIVTTAVIHLWSTKTKTNIRLLFILPCSVLVSCILRNLSTYTEPMLSQNDLTWFSGVLWTASPVFTLPQPSNSLQIDSQLSLPTLLHHHSPVPQESHPPGRPLSDQASLSC